MDLLSPGEYGEHLMFTLSSVAASCGRETKQNPDGSSPSHRFRHDVQRQRESSFSASAKINWWTLTAPHRDSLLSASQTHTYDRVFSSSGMKILFLDLARQSRAQSPVSCRLGCKILFLCVRDRVPAAGSRAGCLNTREINGAHKARGAWD